MTVSKSSNSTNTMQGRSNYTFVIALIFLWIGFVCAISFMEAWLKFQAPGITLSLGLGIGRLVFGALNKVEWVLALALIINFFITKPPWAKKHLFISVVFIVLMIQTMWLLPALDVRAEQVINNISIPESNLHFYFVGLELIKVVCLIIFGVSPITKNESNG
jgi:uncharacterized membrane protein (DUF485 family)